VSRITCAAVSAHTIPTASPESDGTLEWSSTTIVIVELTAGDVSGVGYSYGHKAVATLIEDLLLPLIDGGDPMDVTAPWIAMAKALRNQGRCGISFMAIAAVDVALWDLKARLLDVSLLTLLGQQRDAVPIYGSGGFTSYSVEQLQTQLAGWVEQGISRVKMKVGRRPTDDVRRVQAAREARFVRDHAPARMDVVAGEYGYDLYDFRPRCAGISGFLQVGALCDAHNVPLSSHTASALHLHPCCAFARVRHLEHFHDHARLERLLFDGVIEPVDGMLTPDLSRPGLGLTLKRADADRYAA
jgi:L-alanine-DL-glutamate epimerase-like enolase superfamily enzyme